MQLPPLLRWVRIRWGAHDAPVVAYTYFDPQSGPSARAESAGQVEVFRLAGSSAKLEPLDASEVERRALPERPAWLVDYGPQPRHFGSWLHDAAMRPAVHPERPREVQALFFADGVEPEVLWVRLLDRIDDPTLPVYVGELLSTPRALVGIQPGTQLGVRPAPGTDLPIHIGQRERQNAQRFVGACNACGFDLMPFDCDARIAEQFPHLGPGGTGVHVVQFSAPCPLCDGAMVLSRR